MDTVNKLMQAGIEKGVFPGAVLQVVAEGKTVLRASYGAADIFSGQSMTVDTCFDLASLTKPLATVPAVMKLVERGRLDLDRSCGDLISDIRAGDIGGVTVRQLLNHSSGLPAWRPYFMRLCCAHAQERVGRLRDLLLAETLEARPGERSEYSDLGFMLLQWIVESVSGRHLDRFVTDEVFRPLSIDDLFYNDVAKSDAAPYTYAATQLCPWRNKLLKGQVDDDNAYIIGGVAGHAGLFGTSEAVCRLLQALLAADRGKPEGGVFDPKLVELFFTAPENERWALGFDTPSAEGSSAGQYYSKKSVGHLGFTGTSFWMDRLKGIMIVLLTNRVHPWRFNQGIKEFRPRLHDAVMSSI